MTDFQFSQLLDIAKQIRNSLYWVGLAGILVCITLICRGCT